MKKRTQSLTKTFLAVLMVLVTLFSFGALVAPDAEAATAGTYSVKVT